MKTLFTKSLSVLLCLVMGFSCTATAFAANTIDAKADVKYFQTATEAENAKTTIENFLDQETGEWPAFTQQYYQWKGSIDQFKIDYEKWKSTVDDTLLQYNIRIGRLEGVN